MVSKHKDYGPLLSFIQPPEVRMAVRRVKPLTYEFDVSESVSLNKDGAIANVQWDFDHQAGKFISTQGYTFLRDKKTKRAVLVVEYTFPEADTYTVACSVKDDQSGGANGAVYALDYLPADDVLYVGGEFTEAGGASQFRIARWAEDTDEWLGGQFFYRYDGSSWSTRASLPVYMGDGACLADNDDGYLYALAAGRQRDFYRYHVATDSWGSALEELPDRAGKGAALAGANGHLYALPGGGENSLFRYTPGEGWVELPGSAPDTGIGAALVWDQLDSLYLLAGGSSDDVWRYRLSNGRWQQLDDPNLNFMAAFGQGLAYLDEHLYAYVSPISGNTHNYYRCGKVGVSDTKLTLESTALVAPKTASDPPWLDPAIPPVDFYVYDNGESAWVGDGTWIPEPEGGNLLAYDEADFYESPGLYRVGRESALEAGYYTDPVDAHVSPDYCLTCDNDGYTWGLNAFGSIQAAIDSGALHVLVGAGVYRERFYLVSGVIVSGSSADLTVLEAGESQTGPLVKAEGIAGAALAGMSLIGNGNGDGVRVEDDVQGMILTRMIIRDTATGISLAGDQSDLEVANNTIVDNLDGMVVEGVAPIDVRNTIFAYNTHSGLTYNSTASTVSHTYNDYWANTHDLYLADTGGAPSAGGGELFLNPLFIAPLSYNYHLQDISPAVDAGALNDPAPPGSGNRVDIGYLEQARASYYVDDDYGPKEANDGLTWGIDAFDLIQDALDAASATIAALRGNLPEDGYTVGVGAGTYIEMLTIPSYVHLVGSGADDTVIRPPLREPYAVNFDGVVQAGISDLAVTGGLPRGYQDLDSCRWTPISLATFGNEAHITYARGWGEVAYRHWTGTEWLTEIVYDYDGGPPFHAALATAIAVDAQGYPHICYSTDGESYDLGPIRYLRWTGSDWEVHDVDEAIARTVSLALDSAGHPYISYQGYDNSYRKLHMAHWTGSEWQRQTVDSENYSGGPSSIAVDSQDRPHIVYHTQRFPVSGRYLRYARWTGGAWDIGTVEQHPMVGTISLALDTDDHAHISYYDDSNDQLKYAHWTGTAWDIGIVDSDGTVGEYNSLVLDDEEHPHISYFDESNSALKYAYWTGAAWAKEILDNDNYTGLYGSLALNDQGDPLVAYFGYSSRLRYYTPYGQDAAINISGASNSITLARNLIHNNHRALAVSERSTGKVAFSTFADNQAEAIIVSGEQTWLDVENSILADNAVGLRATGSGLIRNDYNLLHNTSDLDGVTAGENTLFADPAFSSDYHLSASSPAVDAADPLAPVSAGGGTRADMGYKELIASPLMLHFGSEIASTVTGNSGVERVEVGVVFVADPDEPVTATLPSTWNEASLHSAGQTVSHWHSATTPTTTGLYRVYTRAQDVVGNDELDDDSVWYAGGFVADDADPVVTWVSPTTNTSTDQAAIELVARASDYVDAGEGPRFNVERIYFVVGGESYDAAWADEDWDAEAQEPRTFSAHVPLNQGVHDVVAVAVDYAGREGRSSTLSVNASNASHIGTITTLEDGDAVGERTLALQGYVRYTTSAGEGVVVVQVDSETPVQADLADPVATLSAWSVVVTLPDADGDHTLTVKPTRGTSGVDSIIIVELDRIAPNLDVITPVSGAYITLTVSFEGTASDDDSGLTQVQVSVDGGYTWLTADLDGSSFSAEQDLAEDQDAVSYPVRVRATDRAGNHTIVERPVTVDNVPPTGVSPATFSSAQESHLEIGATLGITWTAAVDASGQVTVLLAVDQTTDTEPWQAVPGTHYDALLDSVGDWYVHLGARDMMGNETFFHYGPWHVEDITHPTFGQRQQSIIVDGFLDVDHGEWLTDSEKLDDDERGLETQDFYTAWDGTYLYLGWHGAWWTLDGTLWAYLRLGGPGTTTPVVGDEPLPFAADTAVEITDPTTGTLWRYDGSAWQDEPLTDFACGPNGDTEVRLPWDGGAGLALSAGGPGLKLNGSLSLFTAALDDNGDPWSVFPTTNPLGGPWGSAYHWGDVGTAGNPSEGQPQGQYITLQVSSPQSGGAIWGPGDELQYRIEVENHESVAFSNLQITLDATTGLGYYSPIDPPGGATCTSCPEGGANWELALPAVPAGATHVLTVTGRLAADLSAVTSVTSTVELLAAGMNLVAEPVIETVSHIVDGQPPTVAMNLPPGQTVPVGPWTFSGQASDGDGAGVGQVLVKGGSEGWEAAGGTISWSTVLTVPDTIVYNVSVQAIDVYGHVSPVSSTVLYVDTVPPLVTFDLPPSLYGAVAHLEGTALDIAPIIGPVKEVAVQIDEEDAPWQLALVDELLLDPQNWHSNWTLPLEDGRAHRLRARATDTAGLTTTGDWSWTMVDSVPPAVTVTVVVSQVIVTEYMTSETKTLLLEGTVTDGVGVSGVRAIVYAPNGEAYSDTVNLVGSLWRYEPQVRDWLSDEYALRIVAEDVGGNTRVYGPYYSEIAQELPGLDIDKTISAAYDSTGAPITPLPTEVEPGYRLRYQVVVENVGLSPAYSVTISDTLPAGLLYRDGSARLNGLPVANPEDQPGPALRFSGISETLAAGESMILTFDVDVSSDFVLGTLSNLAETTGYTAEGTEILDEYAGIGDTSDTDPDDPDADDTGIAHTTGVKPALVIDNDILDISRGVGTHTIYPGDSITYRVVVTNVGQGNAYGVNLTVTLPSDAFVYQPGSADQEPVVDGSALFWPLEATLGAGQSLTVTFRARLGANFEAPVTFVSDAWVTGVDGAGTPIAPDTADPADYDDDDHDQAVVTGGKPTGILDLTSSPTACAGWNHTFVMTYTNSTTIPLSEARLVIPVPPHTLALHDLSSPGLLGSMQGLVKWELGTMGIGDIVVRRLVLHLFTSIEHETVLTLDVVAEAFESDPYTVSQSIVVRTDGPCAGPTPTLSPTPTPTVTPTITPTPRYERLFLPLIVCPGNEYLFLPLIMR